MERTHKYFCILLLLFSNILFSQISSSETGSSKVYLCFEVDELPKFNYENKNLSEYIWSKFSWPNNLDVIGEVVISFVVNKKGIVENIKIVKSLDEICDEYSKSLFKNIPNFEPGKIKSKAVNVRMFFPVRFILK